MTARLLTIAIFFISTIALANDRYDMRRCVLLPVTDSAGDSLGFKVFEELENYLKEENWCDYVSSAELIEVFSRYRSGLKLHLKEPRVIETVAQRLNAGTIIRLDLEYEVNQTRVSLDVVGENGQDLYFSEKALLEEPKPTEVAQLAKRWLEIYEATIPYEGKVLGVLGDQVTFSVPERLEIFVGQEFTVRRLEEKSSHPLLRKIVEWNSEVLARGRVANINNQQALGHIRVYEKNKKLGPGDWIALEEFTPQTNIAEMPPEQVEENRFGKLGVAGVYFSLGSGTVGTSVDENKKASGITYGVSADVEAWITREWYVTGELGARLGSFSESSGSLALDPVDVTSGMYRVGGGYKYLPLGYFFGPQISFEAGYASYFYNVEESKEDGFGSNSISGVYLGVGGNMPLKRGVRVYGKAEFMPFSSFKDDDGIFGSEKSSSSLVFKGGALYQYNAKLALDGGIVIQNNSAKLDGGDVSQVSYRDTLLKFGASFTF